MPSLLRSLADVGDMARGAQAIAEGLALGGYQYTTFKSKSEPSKLTRAAIVGGGGKRTQSAIDSGIVLAEAASWARDLVNEPGGSRDRKSTRLHSSHYCASRMPSSARK